MPIRTLNDLKASLFRKLSSMFVRKSGDTMSGTLVMPNNIGILGKKKNNTTVFIGVVDTDDRVLLGDPFANTVIRSSEDPQFHSGNNYYKFWHEGNFNPNDKMDKSGGTFTGNVTIDGGTEYKEFKVRRRVNNNVVDLRMGVNSSGNAEIMKSINDSVVISIILDESTVRVNNPLSVKGAIDYGPVASDPTGSIPIGSECYNVTEKRKKFYDGTRWVDPMKYV